MFFGFGAGLRWACVVCSGWGWVGVGVGVGLGWGLGCGWVVGTFTLIVPSIQWIVAFLRHRLYLLFQFYSNHL